MTSGLVPSYVHCANVPMCSCALCQCPISHVGPLCFVWCGQQCVCDMFAHICARGARMLVYDNDLHIPGHICTFACIFVPESLVWSVCADCDVMEPWIKLHSVDDVQYPTPTVNHTQHPHQLLLSDCLT